MSIPQGLPQPPGWEKRREEMMQATPPYLRNTPIPNWSTPGMGGSSGDIAREEAQDRINNPHLWGQQQAPRPEGFQRVATGIADWLTGNKWDMDQRGKGAKFLKEITKGSKDGNGKTFADNVPNMPPVLGQEKETIDPLDILLQVPAPGQGTGGALDNVFQQDAHIPQTTTDPSIMMDGGFPRRYNPYEGQTITLPDGRVVPRTPENSVPGP